MNELLTGIPEVRLIAKVGRAEVPNGCRSQGLALIGEAVYRMRPDHARVLSWQLGLACETLDVATIAGRLLLPERRVDQLLEEALVELGWALVCAEYDRQPIEKVAA
jgi:hypothetical protein